MKKLLLTLCAATALPGVAAAHGFEFRSPEWQAFITALWKPGTTIM